MTSTHRKFRLVRRDIRRQWFVPWWLMALVGLGCPAMVLGRYPRSVIAWSVCAVFASIVGYRAWQHWRLEAETWRAVSDVQLWFEDGVLHCSKRGDCEYRSLADVVGIDAIVEGTRIRRVLVRFADGGETTHAHYDDMEAFASEFRRNAPSAKFRRMRYGFPMRLKEI